MKLRLYISIAAAIILAGCKKEVKLTKDFEIEELKELSREIDGTGTDKVKNGVLLRLDFPKGHKQEVKYITNTKTKDMSVDMDVDLVMEITSVRSGESPVFEFVSEVKSITMDVDAKGKKIAYNSKNTGNMSLGELAIDGQMRKFIDKPANFSIDSDGRIVEYINEGDHPFDVSSYEIQFPKYRLAVGDSWNTKSHHPKYGSVINTYTLKEVTPDVAIVSFKSITPGIEAEALKGSYTIDRATGMVLKGNMKGKVPVRNAQVDISFTAKKIQ